MSSSLVYVALLLHGAVAGESPTYCVVRGSQKVLLTDTCASLNATSQVLLLPPIPPTLPPLLITMSGLPLFPLDQPANTRCDRNRAGIDTYMYARD